MSDLLTLFFSVLFGGFIFFVLALTPSPSWVRRQRSGPFSNKGHFGGPSPFVHCEKTDKWFNPETGEEVKSIKFSELMAKYSPKCPCGEKHE
jgi:hypothetical protein